MARGLIRGLPTDFFELPLIRSFPEQGHDGNLYRVEIRGHETGLKVRARFPMPHTITGRKVCRTIRDEVA
ncbi:hypothetical protein M2322_002652 [Rhodoblastus acidophilus]|nr:hypothetical protein [Rhodoblastus acidophilus]